MHRVWGLSLPLLCCIAYFEPSLLVATALVDHTSREQKVFSQNSIVVFILAGSCTLSWLYSLLCSLAGARH